MQKTLTFKSTLRGVANLPASKSIANRALLLAAQTVSPVVLHGVSEADDTQILLRSLQRATDKNAHSSHANGKSSDNRGTTPDVFDIGAAGTTMRFLTAYFSSLSGERILTGTERMKHRPIGILVDALRRVGANINYMEREGYPPLRISGGKLSGGTLSLPAGVSSQYISALLLTAPQMNGGLTLKLEGNVASRPYIDLTLGLMREFGFHAGWQDAQTLHVEPETSRPPESFRIEGDWSGAAFWYEMMAISRDADAELFLPGLRRDSLQGDARVAEYFQPLGVHTQYETEGIRLTKQSAASGALEYDLSQQPDLAQSLVVACAMLRRPFRFTGLHSLRIKETDRISALQTELQKFGICVEAEGDATMFFEPSADSLSNLHLPLCGIDTYEDHRMAMSFAPAAILFGGLRINDAQVVSKSYPRFWEEIEKFCKT